MPKIKINEIKSIYTNIDENDSSLDLVRTSVNLRHLKGYAQVEPRRLNQYTIPDLSVWFGQSGWEYETGIYCTLTNDPFATVATLDKIDALILIPKRTSGGVIYRSILFKDLTNNSGWYELTKEGNLSNHNISRSFLNTTKVGETFFQIENGRLKIYMPHDCFWVGRLYRDSTFNYLDYNGVYCDRLVEPFDHNKLTIRLYDSYDATEVPVGTNPVHVSCGTGRRLGVKFNLEYVDDPSSYVGQEDVEPIWDSGEMRWRIVIDSSYSFYLYEHQFILNDGGNAYTPTDAKKWYSITDNSLMPNYHWAFHVSQEGGYWIVPKTLANRLVPKNPDTGELLTWETISVAPGLRTWPVKAHDGEGNVWGEVQNSYKVYAAYAQTLDWVYIPTEASVEESGFSAASDRDFSIIVTAVLDDREEIIIEFLNDIAQVTAGRETFVIKVKDLYLPININKRITRLRFYHKVRNSELDYELHKEIDLLGEEEWSQDFYISKYENEGTLLSTNIAFLFDEEKPTEYKVETGFRSFITEAGISISLLNDDYTKAYYSVLGGGQLQPDIIYDQNLIPISGVSRMNAVGVLNDRFAVYTDNTMYIVTVDQIDGALIFTPQETVALGVKDRRDVANIQGGAIVHTRNGIYITSGTSQQLLSEPINDWVKSYFTTGQILFNKYLNELYYRPDTSHEDLYRFRFDDRTWERLNMSIYYAGEPGDVGQVITGNNPEDEWVLTNAQDILIDLDGQRAYLEVDALWTYASGDNAMPTAILRFNTSDLGEPGIDKLFNEFIFDYAGSWNLYVYDDNSSSPIWSTTLTDHATRAVEKFYYPIANRRAFKKFYFILSTNDSDARLYGIEIDFQVLKQRSYL